MTLTQKLELVTTPYILQKWQAHRYRMYRSDNRRLEQKISLNLIKRKKIRLKKTLWVTILLKIFKDYPGDSKFKTNVQS